MITLESCYKKWIASFWRFLAYPLAWLYALILKTKKTLIKPSLSSCEGVRVLSVGNLDFGGTGKTPTLLLILESLHHLPCGVITRGYGSRYEHQGSQQVNHLRGSSNLAQLIGDEPCLILNKFPLVPLYVGKDRQKGMSEAVKQGCKLILLDDGAQQNQLKVDFNVILLDPKEPLKPLCPVGYRRDTLDTLKKADLVVFPYVETQDSYREAQGVIKSYTTAPCVGLKAQIDFETPGPVAVMTAIARAQRFLDQLENKGAQIVLKRIFDDHAVFSDVAIKNFLIEAKKLGAKHCLCTQKDWVKIKSSYQKDFKVVKLSLKPLFDEVNWETFIGKIRKIP